MKMYEVLMVTLFVNFVMFLFGGIFTYSGIPVMHAAFQNPATFSLTIGVVGLLSALGTVAVINFIGIQASAQGVIFTMVIGAVYWSAYGSTSMVFSNLLGQIPGGFGAIIWAIISIAVIYIFISGITQMVTGGWRGYK